MPSRRTSRSGVRSATGASRCAGSAIGHRRCLAQPTDDLLAQLCRPQHQHRVGVAGDLADEITGYTDAVLVLGPAELREEVVRRLREAAAMADRGPGAPGGTGG